MYADLVLLIGGLGFICLITMFAIVAAFTLFFKKMLNGYKDLIKEAGEQVRLTKQTKSADTEGEKLSQKELNDKLIKKFMK